jgi:predicted naringenin-chalcone synthase
MALTILGLGTAVPSTQVTNPMARQIAQRVAHFDEGARDFVQGLYDHIGIQTRYTVLSPQVIKDVLERTNTSRSPFITALEQDSPGPTTRERLQDYVRATPELAETAAHRALEEAGLSTRHITHLVTVSCTGFHAPGWDIALIKRLPLSSTVARTHVGFMGCHGAINGMRVCQAFAGADVSARVLLVATETCSLHYSYERNVYRLVTNALFADGAAALVGRPMGEGWQLRACASCLFPDAEKAMTWSIGNNGFAMTLSKEVPDLIRDGLQPWLTQWLAEQGLDLQQIGSWAIHPGGPRILESVEAALGLPPAATAASREILAEYGNMSSPTILFVLQRLRGWGAPRPCVALGFGPGLVAEAALFL